MRIALVSPYDLTVPGGVQSHVQHVAARLRELGDHVLVVAPGDRSAPPPGVLAVGAALSIPFNDSVAPIAVSPAAGKRTLEALHHFRPDVVHVHEPAVPMVGLAAALRGPIPVVGTFHAWSDSDRAYRLARPLVARAARRLSARIAVSPAASAYHARALGISEGSFRHVPNGVEVVRFRDAAPIPELVDGPPTLLFVGRLEPRKGLASLLRAFVELKTRRPSVRLVVVGEGPGREHAQSLLPARLRADVLFVGRVDQEDLPRFYRSADLFVSPALGGESFGIVLLEAMAAGVAVVASDIPGYRTVLRDGVEGRFVPAGDPATLADTLDALLSNAALREAMAAQGRQSVQRYDWSCVVDQLRDIYAQVSGAP